MMVNPQARDCPWCGSNAVQIDEHNHWTGQRFVCLSVTLRHWCQRNGPDEFTKATVTFRARTAAYAIEAWNKRQPPVEDSLLETLMDALTGGVGVARVTPEDFYTLPKRPGGPL